MRLIGAGLGRTGTASLKKALEILLGGPCYHMLELFERPQDVPVWRRALAGQLPDWHAFFKDYRASLDWPATPFWESLARAYPEAPILLSTRKSAEVWFESARQTIFPALDLPAEAGSDREKRLEMIREMWETTFDSRWWEPEPAMKAYDAHNARVRALAPPGRLVEWQPGDGWDPLCTALKLPVPNEPFPHLNSTPDFRKMMGFA